MSRDFIIILGVIFLIYKLITYKGKLTLARIITYLGLAIGGGIALLHESVPVFILFFLTIVCMGISLVGMYFMLKNDEFESDKVEMYQSNIKVGVYVWLFLVALYIFLYVLTYY
ncbi:hypothetical protein [uncultured Veillonella sp.]|uniref:hypothetical protein n=1 Tax=uncultured Veillonella sp. TaxID=159268 RepID=UPI0025EE0C61|nr:hypothetical protein [uncultured Veillonella sp.]